MNDSARSSQAAVRPPSLPSSPSSNNPLSIEALEEIVRNCQRNEQRLHELERHTRHERKKAERLLRQTSRVLDDHERVQTREFFVPLDDDGDDQSQTIPGNSARNDQRDLLDRVEKLLAGDGTTTTAASSDVMSSQERQKKVSIDNHHRSPRERIEVEEEKKFRPQSRQLPSACSIEYELSTVDRLLAERTPNHQERKTSKQSSPFDERDERFYERLNNYVQTGRFTSSADLAPAPAPVISSRPSSKISNKDEELADLARRCEDLLSRLHTQRQRAEMLEHATKSNEYYRRLSPSPPPRTAMMPSSLSIPVISSPVLPPPPPPMTLQQALELLRPDFISRSRQRARRIRLLREEREHNSEIDRERRQMLLFSCNTTCCSKPSTHSTNTSQRTLSAPPSRRSVSFIVPHDRSTSTRVPVSYREMKQATKKKYQQLPEVHDRRRQAQMEEIRRRNVLRAKVFRARLRQHVQRYGRTNIDESLTMIDT